MYHVTLSRDSSLNEQLRIKTEVLRNEQLRIKTEVLRNEQLRIKTEVLRTFEPQEYQHQTSRKQGHRTSFYATC